MLNLIVFFKKLVFRLGIIELFLLIGLIIFLGFFSLVFFNRTKIPDVLILLFFGMLLGPILRVVDPTPFAAFAPLVGSLALIIILFDSGLDLNLFKVLTSLWKAALFSVLVFTLSSFGVAMLLHYAFAWSLMHSLLLGVVVSGTSSATILSIVSRLNVSEETRILLGLESVVNDVLTIVSALTIIQVIQMNAVDFSVAAHAVVGAFSIAAVVGFVAGLFWIIALRKFYGKSFGYVVTLATLFIVYAFVEALKGSGALSALVFGLILGNSVEIARGLRMQGEFEVDKSIKMVQTEITFFVRTFFFVFIGVIFNFAALKHEIVFIAALLTLVLLAARVFSTKLLSVFDSSIKKYELVIATILPRGLAAAVLAFLPLSYGIKLQFFTEIVFIIILSTNVIATIGAFAFEWTNKREKRPAVQAAGKAEQKMAFHGGKPRVVSK